MIGTQGPRARACARSDGKVSGRGSGDGSPERASGRWPGILGARGRLGCVIAALALCCMLALPAMASATGSYSIEGTVREAGSSNAPIEKTAVCAFYNSGSFYERCALTNSAGEYAIESLPEGSYRVVFNGGTDCSLVLSGLEQYASCPHFGYVRQYWEDASYEHATFVTVDSTNVAVSGIDASMAIAGRIEGMVTNAAIGKEPIDGVVACAFPTSVSTTFEGECGGTSPTGEYTIEGLPTGTYDIAFFALHCEEVGGKFECTEDYSTQYYDGKAHEGEANPVTVDAPNATSGIDASMVETAAIARKPASIGAPALTGTTAVGQTLTCSEGTWSGNPTSLAYSWMRNGTPIAGQTGSTYVVQAADQGQTITCQVTASNVAGAASATSNGVAIPVPAVKEETKPPTEETKPPVKEEVKEPAPEPTPGVAVAGGVAKVKAGKALLKLHCTGAGACEGSLKLIYKEKIKKVVKRHGKVEVLHRTKTLIVGKAKFSIAAGGHETLKVKLTKLGAALAEKVGRHGLNVALSGSGVKARNVRLNEAGKPKGRKGSHRGHR